MDAAIAQTTTASASGAGSVIGMLGSLALVLLVIFALAYVVRRLQSTPMARGALMRIHGGVQVGSRERVMLIEAGGEQFLIGVAQGQVNLLHRFDQPIAATTEPAPVPPFADKLAQLLRRNNAS